MKWLFAVGRVTPCAPRLALVCLAILPLAGCMTRGGLAKAIEAAGPPKDKGIVRIEYTGWNAHFTYLRDTTDRPTTTNGSVTITPTTTLKVQ